MSYQDVEHSVGLHVFAYTAGVVFIGVMCGAAVMVFIHEIRARTAVQRQRAAQEARFYRRASRALAEIAASSTGKPPDEEALWKNLPPWQIHDYVHEGDDK